MSRASTCRALTRLATSLAILSTIGIAGAQVVPSSEIKGLKWRNIGPFRGGRVSAVTGIPTQPDTFYIGLPQGGVWKTTSAGQTWYPVFDAVKGVCSVGSVQVAPANPNIVYAGTGEISGGGTGNGVYKSTDAGKTWTHIGLDESDMVPSMLVDPKDPNLLLAAAVGKNQQAGPDRGVFRTSDGGKTWKRTLAIDNETGVQHIAWAYDNPSLVFAATQRRFRGFGGFGGGGSFGSALGQGPDLYKSTDEGLTWKKLSPIGLPRISGRVCLAVAMGTHSQRVFLIGTFGLYRSDDGGENWTQMAANDSRIANGQGAYTSGVYVDPKNPDIVYTLATCSYRSLDGGKTFAGFKGAPGGDDPQQLWINPLDGSHMLLAGDQGASVTLDAGRTWGLWYNQPTGQVYHVSTDNRFPYWVYATQQDSGCIGTSSRGNLGAITPVDWYPMEGNEGGYIVVNPTNPNVSFAVGPVSGLVRVTEPSGQWVQIEPNMSSESQLRGGNGQMEFSPSNLHELMLAYQYLLSTTDDGDHWKKLSPDLTIDPKAKPVKDGNRRFAAISSFSPSAVSNGIIWVGTSNGLIWATTDHGHTWEDVRITGEKGQSVGSIGDIEASPVDANTAYAVINTVISGTSTAHIYRTHDFGKTWNETSGRGLEAGQRINVLRLDTKQEGLLFALAGRDVIVSFNDGDDWQPLTLNLPTTQLSDLRVKGNDLVLGTYGRGIWILDDFSPLRQKIQGGSVRLYEPATAYRLRRNTNMDTPFPPEVPHAQNPPLGAILYYSLPDKPPGLVTIQILDSSGKVVRHMSSAPIAPYDDPPPLVPNFWIEKGKPLPSEPGLNRVNWNIRYDTPPSFTHDVSDVMGAEPGKTPEAIEGPLALPGEYTVRLTVDGKTFTQKLTVKDDPRSTVRDRDLRLEQPVRLGLYEGIVEAWDGYRQVEGVRASLADLLKSKPSDAISKAARALDENLAKVAGTVSHSRRFYGPPSPNSFVGLNGFLLATLDYFDYGDVAPTEPMLEKYGSDWSLLKAVSDQWRTLQKKDLAVLNDLLTKNGLRAIAVPGSALVDPPSPNKRYLPKPGAPGQSRLGFPGNVYRGGDDDDRGGDGGDADGDHRPA